MPRLQLREGQQARLLGGISLSLLQALPAWQQAAAGFGKQEAAGKMKALLVRQALCLPKAAAAARLPLRMLQAWIGLAQRMAGKRQAAGEPPGLGCAAGKSGFLAQELPAFAQVQLPVAAGAGQIVRLQLGAALAFCQTTMRTGIFSAAEAGFGLQEVLQLAAQAAALG